MLGRTFVDTLGGHCYSPDVTTLRTRENLELFLSAHQIHEVVERLAGEVSRDYQDKSPLVVGVLCGSFIFVADLVRHLTIPVNIDFVQLESYTSTASTGRVKVSKWLRTPARGRDVLLVEDIVDTGLSASYLLRRLQRDSPASVRVCALLDKPSRRQVEVPIHYRGFTVPDRFLVGYGLDMDQEYRHLPDIYVLKE